MASYMIILNGFFAALVLTGITGSLLWAIATQRRDWPAGSQAAVPHVEPMPQAAPATSVPVLGAELATV